jgi:hypothetical protein
MEIIKLEDTVGMNPGYVTYLWRGIDDPKDTLKMST